VNVGPAATPIVFGLLFAFAAVGCRCGSDRPKFIYRLDRETKGWVVIVLDRPGAPALRDAGGNAFTVDIPKSGVVVTSTKAQVGIARDEFWIRNPSGQDEPLQESSVHAEHIGWTRKGDGKPMEYDIFFIGTEAELKAAEPEEAFVARVYASLE
jgi:hypothetical protein